MNLIGIQNKNFFLFYDKLYANFQYLMPSFFFFYVTSVFEFYVLYILENSNHMAAT